MGIAHRSAGTESGKPRKSMECTEHRLVSMSQKMQSDEAEGTRPLHKEGGKRQAMTMDELFLSMHECVIDALKDLDPDMWQKSRQREAASQSEAPCSGRF